MAATTLAHVFPRRGETRPALQRPPAGRVSVHSPCVRGRLQNRLDKTGKSRRFPHVPTRGRLRGASASANPRGISIHVPAQDTTVPRAPWPRHGSHSTPSACTGCDRCPPNRSLFINLFQSMHPHEVRPDAVSPPEGRRLHLNLRSAAPHPPGPSPPSAPRRAKRARGRLPRALLTRSVPLISPSWRLQKPDRPLSSRCPRPFQSGRT